MSKKSHSSFKDPKVLVLLSLFAALSILFGKYLAIPGGDVLRFSFENLPIFLAALHFGPIAGILVGVLADLLGCLMVGYAINPLVTLGAASIGLVGGILPRLMPRKLPLLLRLSLSVTVAHIIGSVIIKTFGLAAYYSMPFFILMLWRLLNYAIIAVLEIALLFFISKNAALSRQLRAFAKDSPML